MVRLPPRSTLTDTLFPYTTLFRSDRAVLQVPENGEMFLDDIMNSGRHSMRAVAYDAILFTRPWGFSVRSEEHTSELQSLMRISYAVFCLKKKNTKLSSTMVNHKCRDHTPISYTQHNIITEQI